MNYLLKAKRKKLKQQIRYHLKEHQRIDKANVSEQVKADRTAQTLNTLNAAHEKIDRFLKQSSPRMGAGKVPKEVKSKGTIQGYNGIASVDKKHQVIIDAQAFGSGQEQQTLQPVLEAIDARYQRLGIHPHITQSAIVTADTGFASESNNQYLHDQRINAYIPDNQFRSRDPKFEHQKKTYGKQNIL